MTVDIIAVDFDMTKFRFSPFTVHNRESEGSVQFMIYDDSNAPKDNPGLVSLFNEAATDKKVGETLHVTMSGLKADPSIDFHLGNNLTSISAAEYLTGYNEYLAKQPEELLNQLETNPNAVDHLDTEWSIDYFKGKLTKLVGEQNDNFFIVIYRGIDNAMGDLQRSMVLYSIDSPHKEMHGSFDVDPRSPAPSNKYN